MEDKFQAMPVDKHANHGKQVRYPVLERDLVKWVESQRKDGYIITPMHIKLQAMKISKTPKYLNFQLIFQLIRDKSFRIP